MRIVTIQIFLLLILTSCSSRIKDPIEFGFKDRNIEAIATFSKVYNKDKIYFGNLSIKNLSPDKRVFINAVYLENGTEFIKIDPDYIVNMAINIRRMQNYEYKIMARYGNKLEDPKRYIMKIGYTLQDDNIPNYKLTLE